MHGNSADRPQKRLDFRAGQSVDAQGRPRPNSEPRAATAPAGTNGGACGGDGAAKRMSTGVQIMSKSRKPNTAKALARPARNTTRNSKPKTPQPPVTKPASLPGTMISSATPPRPSKKAAILALLQRPEGAALGDLTAATGWQVHSVRAALTGLRKEGKELGRAKDAAGVTHYRLAANA